MTKPHKNTSFNRYAEMSGIFRNRSHKGVPPLHISTLKINTNQEKKWHCYLKMDKNKCPILKSARESSQRPSLKKSFVCIML